jgi:SAM-dependent methyltransferase
MTTQDEIRRRYAASARAVASGQASAACCGGSGTPTGQASAACCGGSGAMTGPEPGGARADAFGVRRYSEAELAELPAMAREASLGCGNPLAVADLRPGETVLDLGSGAGRDVLLSAHRVGPTGTVYGLDMTDEMLDLARRNAAEASVANVEFRKGTIEQIPLPDASIDVVISNCVINLSADKAAVFAQTFRVLRPGGRIGVTDVIADDALSPEQRAERGEWTACIAGALSRSEYVDGLTAAGFTDVDVTITHDVADGMYSAIIRAVRP